MNYKILILLLSIVFISSCSSVKKINESAADGKVENRILYIIHGDASYLYHVNNQKKNADKEALKQALNVAQSLNHSEIFIFHQKPKKKFLFFFPKNDRDFYHFINGKLINKKTFRIKESDEFHEMNNFITQNGSKKPGRNFLFYFGHQIPEKDEANYFDSDPEKIFGINYFAKGIDAITKSMNSKFALIAISTCNNGTPYAISTLKDYADFILASPTDLHLSYINSNYILKLNEEPEIETEKLINEIAQKSFNELTKVTEDVTSLVIYNIQKLNPVLEALNMNYTLLDSKSIDCVTVDSSKFARLKKGVKVFYKAPKFGKDKNQNTHSGWGCSNLK